MESTAITTRDSKAGEERHKFGQHYTNEVLVDVVNACRIRKTADKILDPTCGSRNFLVRA
jgi:type I restriction-modification system DNA methylase subunit